MVTSGAGTQEQRQNKMEGLGVSASVETRGSGKIEGEPDGICLVPGEPRVPHNPTSYAHWALVSECRESWRRGSSSLRGPGPWGLIEGLWSLGVQLWFLVTKWFE